MFHLALLRAARPGDARGAADAPPKPEVALFSRAVVVGWEISEGFGLKAELGAPGDLGDIVEASLLFPIPIGVERRTFSTAAVAGGQFQAAVNAKASLIVAVDYLIPFVYADAGSDEKRLANVEAELQRLGGTQIPLMLGTVPDLTSASKILNPLVPPKFLPQPATLARINERIASWAREHTNVFLAPIAAEYAHIEAGEPFGVRASAWPKSWLSEMVQKDRVHTRMHGSIAAWLLGLDALCTARKEIDPASFDWSSNSIFRKVYASKDGQRRAAATEIVDTLKLPPNRPPPGPPQRPLVDPDEEVRRKERGESDTPAHEETDAERKAKKQRGEQGHEDPPH